MSTTATEKGKLAIHSENIFPIIKKFLYSDNEIFLRELVSNAVDASQKIQKLANIGEFDGELDDLSIEVSINKEAGTLTVSDKGIGMTAEEIKQYINQIAFSGATEFLEKYKDKGEDQQIIGHFGLGFYSAFMVAKKVEINTLSYQEGAEAAHWVCEGESDFEINPAVKKQRGTEIVLHLAEDSEEFLESQRIRGILDKYCSFMPIPIKFEEEQINDTEPLWTKQPSELSDQDYQDFYKKLYPMAPDPEFYIHLNVDYPFTLTGVLYFPKVTRDFVAQQHNKINLYSRQVFITDEVKDVVPEWLTLLHGVLDSPDIPLNVSRSYLQADSNVRKINSHITKKVADKLAELFKNDRESYQQKWDSIGLFVKYGMVTDDKFFERAQSHTLLKNVDGEFYTIQEYKEKIQTSQTDQNGNVVLIYTNDPDKQAAFIRSVKNKGYDVLQLDGMVDTHFAGTLEQKLENTQVKRVDAETPDKIVDTGHTPESVLTEEEQNRVTEIYKKAIGNENAQVSVEAFGEDEQPVTITVPEMMRRMVEMSAMQGTDHLLNDMEAHYQIAVNGNHALTKKLLEAEEAESQKLARQAYDLALLSQNNLKGEQLNSFIERTVELMK